MSEVIMLERSANRSGPSCAKHRDAIWASLHRDRAYDAFECLSGACAGELVGYVMDRLLMAIETRQI